MPTKMKTTRVKRALTVPPPPERKPGPVPRGTPRRDPEEDPELMEDIRRRMERDAFPGILSRLREAAGLSQKELADDIGVHQVRVSKWERGRGTPRPHILKLMARALGVSLETLCGDGAELRPPPRPPGRPRKEQVVTA